MANEFLAISDGTFILSESENKNQFYFYRNDGGVLTDIDREPIDLYTAYTIKKLMDGEIADMVMHNISLETSDDGKCIRLTVCDMGDKSKPNINSTVSNKRPNFLKRLFHKIFW